MTRVSEAPTEGEVLQQHPRPHTHGHTPGASPRPRASGQHNSPQASPRALFHALRQAHPSVSQPKQAHGSDEDEDAEWADASAALKEQQLQHIRRVQEEQLRHRLEERVGKTVPLLSPRHLDKHASPRSSGQQQQQQSQQQQQQPHCQPRPSPAAGAADRALVMVGPATPRGSAPAAAAGVPGGLVRGPYPGPQVPPAPAQLQDVQLGPVVQHPPSELAAGPAAEPLLLPPPTDADALALVHPEQATSAAGAAHPAPAVVDHENNPNYYEEFGDIRQYSFVRRAAIRTVCNADFELLVTLIIFGNCVTLTLYNPMQPDDSPHNEALFWTELALNIFYTFEAAIRMTALGGARGYFGQPWNQFDFTMVVLGYISILPINSNGNEGAVRALRALRALRVLRTITRFEGLRAVVVCFLEAVPLLSAAFFLVMAYLLLFAVAAVQMYTNVFHNICAETLPVQLPSGAMDNITVFENSGDDQDMFGCSSPERLGWWYRECPDNYSCIVTPESTSVNCPGFDNVGLAFLTNFQLMTLTGWSFIMFRTIDNTSPFAGIYFIAIVMIGAYLLINLFLAVLKTKFAKAQTIFQEKKKAKARSTKNHNTLQKLFNSAKGKLSEISSKHSQMSILNSKLQSDASKRMVASQLGQEPAAGAGARAGSGRPRTGSGRPVAEGVLRGSSGSGLPEGSALAAARSAHVASDKAVGGRKKARVARFAGDDADSDAERETDGRGTAQPGQAGVGVRAASGSGHGGAAAPVLQRSADGSALTSLSGVAAAPSYPGFGGTGGAVGPEPPANAALAMEVMSAEEFDEFVSDLPTSRRNLLRAQFRVRKLVMWPMFDNFYLLAIMVNTVLLAMDYHGAPDSYQMALWNANIALTSMFTLEMVLKLFGLGFWDYVRDGFNVFDMLIVAMSLSEVIVVTVLGPASLQGTSALRTLRALRVLRLFKMFKYISSLRRIGEVLMTSFTSFASIMVLLCIFWLLFAIIGLHVFGGLPLEDANYIGYPNFDTFLNSMVSTFNILNMENYQNQWGAVARVNGWGIGAFYVVWILIGKYVCVSLFLAVMLEAFEAKYDAVGGGGTNATGMSGLRSRMSGMLSSVRSKLSGGGSVRGRSPPESPRRPKLLPAPHLAHDATAREASATATAAAAAAPDGLHSAASRVPLLQLHRGSVAPGPGIDRASASDAHTPPASRPLSSRATRAEAVPQVESVKSSVGGLPSGIGSRGSAKQLIVPSSSARRASTGAVVGAPQGCCACGALLGSSGQRCAACQQGGAVSARRTTAGPVGEGVEPGEPDPVAASLSARGMPAVAALAPGVALSAGAGVPLAGPVQVAAVPIVLSSRRASMEWRPIPEANISGGGASATSTPRSIEAGLSAWLGTPRHHRRKSAVAPAPPPKPDPSAPPPSDPLQGQRPAPADAEDFDPDMAEYLGAIGAPRRSSAVTVAPGADPSFRHRGVGMGGMGDMLAQLQAELAGPSVPRPAGPAPPEAQWPPAELLAGPSVAVPDRRAATAEPRAWGRGAPVALNAAASASALGTRGGGDRPEPAALSSDLLDAALLELVALPSQLGPPRRRRSGTLVDPAVPAARRHSVATPEELVQGRTLGAPSLTMQPRMGVAGAPAPVSAAMPSSHDSQSPRSSGSSGPSPRPPVAAAATQPLFIPTLNLSAVRAAAAAAAQSQQTHSVRSRGVDSSRRSSADGALGSSRQRGQQQQQQDVMADGSAPLRRSLSGAAARATDRDAADDAGQAAAGGGNAAHAGASVAAGGRRFVVHTGAASRAAAAAPRPPSNSTTVAGSAAPLPSQGGDGGGAAEQRAPLGSESGTANMDSAKDMHGRQCSGDVHGQQPPASPSKAAPAAPAGGDGAAAQGAGPGSLGDKDAAAKQGSRELLAWKAAAACQVPDGAGEGTALREGSKLTASRESPQGVKSAALSSDSSLTPTVADKAWPLDDCDVRKAPAVVTEVGVLSEDMVQGKDAAKDGSLSREPSHEGSRCSGDDDGTQDGEDEDDRELSSSGKPRQRKRMTAEERFRRRQARRNGAIPIEGTGLALWYFDEDHPARVAVYNFVTNPYFDYALLIIITLNCVAMAMEGPMWAPGSPMFQALYWCDVGFTILFGIEAAIKMFAFTFVAYIKDITNQVDFAIVVVSVLVIALEALLSSAAAIQGLRALRAIKPLRMLTRSAGMRMVFKSIAMSLAAMGNVSIVLLMFFLIFAILGTQLFMGLLYSCNDGSVADMSECVGSYVDPASGQNTTREWSNTWPNFDNVGNSLLVCFMLATLNGYTTTMIQTMNAPAAYGEQPRWMGNKGAFFFYVAFVFIVAFALLNLYIGVIFSQFTKIRLAGTGSAFLTNDQQEWAELTKMVFKLKPSEKAQKPKSKLRAICFSIANNQNFEMFVLLVILMNMGVLASSTYNQSHQHIRLTEQLNYFFCSVYFLECVVKITGLGWRMYWKDTWNKFDFVLVLLAVVDLAVSNLAVSFIRALRVLRAQKLLRLLRNSSFPQVARAANNIRSLANVLIAAIPGFGNVLALIGLVLFMYSYVGVILFGNLIWNVGINEHTNFNNFGNALLLLIRVATLDNWWDIMTDTLATPENSQCTKEDNNCGTYAALFYFISYIIIVTIILLNLFTAVIIETFEKTHNQEDWKLSPQSLETFVQLWSQYDDGSGTITPKDLEDLLMHLDPPLGLGPEVNSKDVLRFVYDLDIPLIQGRVPFHKTAFELVKRVSQSKIPDGEVKEQLDKLVGRFFHNLQQEELLNFSTAVVVSRVQKRWRARTRAIKLRRRKDWRRSRDITAGAPQLSLTSLNDSWDSLVQKYKDYKQSQRLLWEIEGKKGNNPLEQRWRFLPTLHPKAAEMEKDAWGGAKRLLRGIIGIGRPKLLPTPAAADEDKPLLSARRNRPGSGKT